MDNSPKKQNLNSKILFAAILIIPEILFITAGYYWICILWALLIFWFAFPKNKKE